MAVHRFLGLSFYTTWSLITLRSQAFERCEIPSHEGLNLLFESLTSSYTLHILRELPRTDPELWAKISGDEDDTDLGVELEQDLLDGAAAIAEVAVSSGLQDDDSDGDDDLDDTFITPTELMASILRYGESVEAPRAGLANQLDPGHVHVPGAEDY